VEILLKQNVKTKNKLLKIRIEMIKNSWDIGSKNNINSNSNYYNKLCKFSESDHHRRLITYVDLDSTFYILNEESLCFSESNNNKKLNKHEMYKEKVKYTFDKNNYEVMKKVNYEENKKCIHDWTVYTIRVVQFYAS